VGPDLSGTKRGHDAADLIDPLEGDMLEVLSAGRRNLRVGFVHDPPRGDRRMSI
jgi:hypothetical protein